MLRAAIYTRISTDPSGTSTATTRQLEDCRALLAARGWEEAGVYEDPDISAYSRTVVRPSFERMKADIAGGRIDAVVAWKLDRLFRGTRDFSALDDICVDAGAIIVTVVDGIDTGTSAGRMVATMMTGLARAESENISIRARRKAAELARDGKVAGGGQRMFGYTTGFRAIIPEEAAHVRDAARRLLAGESVLSICTDWNARGLRTSAGTHWRTTTLRRAVTSYQISGQRFHRGVVSPAQWPAVIPPDEHQALLRLFEGRLRGKQPPRTHYLTGLLRCSVCGEAMRGGGDRRGKRRYSCARAHRSRLADPLEEYVRDLLFERRFSAENLLTAYTLGVYSPFMANEKTRAVTVRIPIDVLDFLDAEAEGRGHSRSRVFTERLQVSISRAHDCSKTAQKSINSDEVVIED